MDDLELTDTEDARVMWACAWVKATPAFFPYLRTFLAARLARTQDGALVRKITHLNVRQTFRLWEHIKEKQATPEMWTDQPRANLPSSFREPAPRERNDWRK